MSASEAAAYGSLEVSHLQGVDYASLISNRLPDRVILQPVRRETVAAPAEEGAAKALVAGTDLETSTLPKILNLFGYAAPSGADAQTVRESYVAEALAVPDAVVASQTLSHGPYQIKLRYYATHY